MNLLVQHVNSLGTFNQTCSDEVFAYFALTLLNLYNLLNMKIIKNSFIKVINITLYIYIYSIG